jgi:Coenzyme PQQ synthesis protein D (PqqD)
MGRRKARVSEMVTFSDRVVVPSYVLVRHLDGETVLLNLETEKYFGLDGTGTRMWEIATHAPTIEAAYGKLQEEFEVEADVLRDHLAELLGQLVANGLLKAMPADVGSIPAI